MTQPKVEFSSKKLYATSPYRSSLSIEFLGVRPCPGEIA